MELDITVLMIANDKVISRTTCDENLAHILCVSVESTSHRKTTQWKLFPADYIVVSRDDEILWIVDGMTPEWYVPENRQDVFNRYPELKGKF